MTTDKFTQAAMTGCCWKKISCDRSKVFQKLSAINQDTKLWELINKRPPRLSNFQEFLTFAMHRQCSMSVGGMRNRGTYAYIQNYSSSWAVSVLYCSRVTLVYVENRRQRKHQMQQPSSLALFPPALPSGNSSSVVERKLLSTLNWHLLWSLGLTFKKSQSLVHISNNMRR